MVTEAQIREALKEVYDPELRLDIIFLGLVYGITIQGGQASVRMTFTSPMCPYGPMLVDEVKRAVEKVAGVAEAKVDIVFDPPWQPSEEVKMSLGIS